MTGIISPPYLRAPKDAVSAEPWQTVADGAPAPLPSVLPHWDSNAKLSLLRRVSVDMHSLATHCRLDRSDKIRACAVWRSTGTALRGRGASVELAVHQHRQDAVLQAEITGHLLAGDLHLHSVIVLSETRARSRPLSARLAGSVLWDERSVVALEGSASRFPMEMLDFNATHWAPYQAGWYLAWNKDDLQIPFLRNIRLYLNSMQPAVAAAVRSTNPTSEQQAIRSAIYYDVGRQLIRGALQSEDLLDSPADFSEGSTGHALLRLMRMLFPSEALSGLRSTMVERSEYFDSMLQASLKVFREV
jgi:hypothetical protein